ncbi:MAG: ATP-binding cassette domain-containing protein, partial [Parasporobacterium sp.]|nr:ATP-binding cassette domain-containing protein [Parasporobacterium sp.]
MSIQLIDVSYIYGSDTPMPVRALDHINLEIPKGQFIGIIGHTGSGKSTLIQMLNGLLKPGSGQVLFD